MSGRQNIKDLVSKTVLLRLDALHDALAGYPANIVFISAGCLVKRRPDEGFEQ